MFKSIGLRNVRLFADPGYTFDLNKLTVFCGTNSSGKSTILRSLLLLRQSQGTSETYGKRAGILQFTGTQVDLGDYASFVTDRKSDRDIQISITTERGRMPKPLAVSLLRSKGIQPDFNPRDTHVSYDLQSSFSFKSSKTITGSQDDDKIKSTAPSGILKEALFNLILQEKPVASWSVSLVPPRGKAKRNSYRLSLPRDEIRQSDKDFLTLQTSNNTSDQRPITVEILLDGLLPYYAILRTTQTPQYQENRLTLPNHIGGALRGFAMSLNQIHYMAPLRASSRRYYLANIDLPPDLDPRGDFLPYLLSGIIEEPKVRNIPPRGKRVLVQSLTKALNCWIAYLRTGTSFNVKSHPHELETTTTKGTLVEISLKSLVGSTKHSIIDSGFGYSQVIPILVRGLMAPVGSTFIVEQPELHLNPALQVRLADFFISMIRLGKQVILETHSEHIVNAIRARIANETSRYLSDNTIIYFIDVIKSKPVVHQMNVQEDGTLPKWPSNFFGEAATLTGEILRAQIYHRKHTIET